jgi:hypothetical protein
MAESHAPDQRHATVGESSEISLALRLIMHFVPRASHVPSSYQAYTAISLSICCASQMQQNFTSLRLQSDSLPYTVLRIAQSHLRIATQNVNIEQSESN